MSLRDHKPLTAARRSLSTLSCAYFAIFSWRYLTFFSKTTQAHQVVSLSAVIVIASILSLRLMNISNYPRSNQGHSLHSCLAGINYTRFNPGWHRTGMMEIDVSSSFPLINYHSLELSFFDEISLSYQRGAVSASPHGARAALREPV